MWEGNSASWTKLVAEFYDQHNLIPLDYLCITPINLFVPGSHTQPYSDLYPSRRMI